MSQLELSKKDKSRLRYGLNVLDWDHIKNHPQFSVVSDEIEFIMSDMFLINRAIFKVYKDSTENTFGLSTSNNHKLMYLNFAISTYSDELNRIIKYLMDSVNDEGQLILDPPKRDELAKKFGIEKEIREWTERLIVEVNVTNKVK